MYLNVSVVQLFMPYEHLVTKEFLKEILKDEKHLLKISEVKMINIPKYDELSVRNLWEEVMQDDDLRRYFPTIKNNSKLPNRDYFFGIINTLHPEYLQKLISHANEIRNKSC
jgi:hypothetical protein